MTRTLSLSLPPCHVSYTREWSCHTREWRPWLLNSWNCRTRLSEEAARTERNHKHKSLDVNVKEKESERKKVLNSEVSRTLVSHRLDSLATRTKDFTRADKQSSAHATSMHTAAANKAMTRSAATSMNTGAVNKGTTRSAATSMNTASTNKAMTGSAATSMNSGATNKATTKSAATSMNTASANKATTGSAATSMNTTVVNKGTTRSSATSMKTAASNKGTTRRAKTSIKTAAANKGSTRSAATSMNTAAVNKVSTKIAAEPVSKLELGQSSKPIFFCDICTDSTALEESFSVKGCHHKYCNKCVNNYVSSRLGENIAYIRCPGSDCNGTLEPDYCRPILPQEVFVKWCEKLCEDAFQGFAKIYCPFKDCSGMLIDDGTEKIKESECPHCRRLFCAQCKVPWHSEIDCENFQKVHKHERQREDIMLMKLAQAKEWKRCPNCKMYVERASGCRYIKCRCGASFCYGCGTTDIDLTSHYCNRCRA